MITWGMINFEICIRGQPRCSTPKQRRIFRKQWFQALGTNSGRDGYCLSNSLKALGRTLDLGNVVKNRFIVLLGVPPPPPPRPVAKESKSLCGSSKFKDTDFRWQCHLYSILTSVWKLSLACMNYRHEVLIPHVLESNLLHISASEALCVTWFN